jgi:hypothetical protein
MQLRNERLFGYCFGVIVTISLMEYCDFADTNLTPFSDGSADNDARYPTEYGAYALDSEGVYRLVYQHDDKEIEYHIQRDDENYILARFTQSGDERRRTINRTYRSKQDAVDGFREDVDMREAHAAE